MHCHIMHLLRCVRRGTRQLLINIWFLSSWRHQSSCNTIMQQRIRLRIRNTRINKATKNSPKYINTINKIQHTRKTTSRQRENHNIRRNLNPCPTALKFPKVIIPESETCHSDAYTYLSHHISRVILLHLNSWSRYCYRNIYLDSMDYFFNSHYDEDEMSED